MSSGSIWSSGDSSLVSHSHLSSCSWWISVSRQNTTLNFSLSCFFTCWNWRYYTFVVSLARSLFLSLQPSAPAGFTEMQKVRRFLQFGNRGTRCWVLCFKLMQNSSGQETPTEKVQFEQNCSTWSDFVCQTSRLPGDVEHKLTVIWMKRAELSFNLQS